MNSKFEIDYSAYLPEFGVLNIDAQDAEEAELEAIRTIKELHPEAINITVEMVKKL